MSLSRRLAVLALAVPLSAAAAQQNPVTLRMNLREGQTAWYRTVIETYTARPGAAMDTTRPTNTIHVYTSRTIAAVRGDTAIIQDVVDSARLAPQGAMPSDSVLLRRVAEGLRGGVTVLAVDGRGRLLAAAAGTTNPLPVDPEVAGALPMAGMFRVVFVLPANPVRPGETWREQVSDGDAGSAVTLTATYTLQRTLQRDGRNIAVISAQGEMGGGGGGGAIAARLDADIEYDMGDSQVSQATIRMNGTIAARGASVPIRVRRTITRLR